MNSLKQGVITACLILVVLVFGTYSFFHLGALTEQSLSAQAISATTLIVAKDGTGNFKTIQDCVDEAKPGQTCRVMTGIYDERVLPTKSGMPRSPIIILADGKVKVRGFQLDHKNFITIQGFE